jgi:hypothetical protein
MDAEATPGVELTVNLKSAAAVALSIACAAADGTGGGLNYRQGSLPPTTLVQHASDECVHRGRRGACTRACSQ